MTFPDRIVGWVLPLWLAGAVSPVFAVEAVRINEILAISSNVEDLRPRPPAPWVTQIRGRSVTSDWIELKNLSTQPVDLAGWSLTDDPDNLDKWTFPGQTLLSPGQCLRVYASGWDPRRWGPSFRDDAGQWHTSFELSADGEFLALVRPDGATVESQWVSYPPQRGFVSYGWTATGLGYLTSPTPGADNSGRYEGVVSPVRFDPGHGFFHAPVEVRLDCPTEGAEIRVTFDGSRPTAEHGQRVDGPIRLERTTCLRAAAFRPGWLASEVTTQTYLFLDEVATQGTDPATGRQRVPAGYPASWGGTSGDYQVDPDITDPEGLFGSLYATGFADALRAIPSLSLVAPIEDLFGPDGIYIHQEQDGTERFGSMELWDAEGTENLTINCGLRMQGGASPVAGGTTLNRWKCKKLSFRLTFRGIYGGKLEAALFGPQATDRFETIVLDSRPQNSWVHSDPLQRAHGEYVRDQVASDTQLALSGPGAACHGRAVHLYLNGLYWGLYWLHERPDAAFAASYFGGDEADYDVIKHRWDNPISGDSQAYLALFDLSPTEPDDVTAFDRLQGLLDIDDFIDYMIANYFLGNGDWDHKNWYATYNRVDPAGRWRWHMWDGEHVMEDGEKSYFGRPDNTGYRITSLGPTGLHWKWIVNDEYRLRFGDRVHRHFVGDGPLTPAGFLALFDRRTAEIDRAIVGESARWGDVRRADQPYSRDLEWLTECERLRHDWIAPRRDRVLAQFDGTVTDYPKNPPWMGPTAAPALRVDGVVVEKRRVWAPPGAALSLEAPGGGTVWFMLDGTDPRLPGGAVDPGAQQARVPWELSGPVRLRARCRADDGSWSALTGIDVLVGPVTASLRVTELMYHPLDGWPEYLVLTNTGSDTLDLDGVTLAEAVRFVCGSRLVPPNGSVVVTEDPVAFAARYPAFSGAVLGPYAGRLSNAGETVVLLDGWGQAVQRFSYRDDWFASTDGGGRSLVIRDPLGDLGLWSRPEGWHDRGGLAETAGD